MTDVVNVTVVEEAVSVAVPDSVAGHANAAGAAAHAGLAIVSASAPSSPATDQLWYDKANELMKRWDGSAWQTEGSGAYLTPATGFPTTGRDPYGPTGNGTVFIANNGWLLRFLEGGTISSIGVDVGTQSGNICVAVYPSTGSGRNAAPDWANRRATSGSVACPATGFQTVSLGSSIDVEAGDWVYLGADNTTAQFKMLGSGGANSELFKGIIGRIGSFPAPNTTTAITWGNQRPFLLVGVA